MHRSASGAKLRSESPYTLVPMGKRAAYGVGSPSTSAMPANSQLVAISSYSIEVDSTPIH